MQPRGDHDWMRVAQVEAERVRREDDEVPIAALVVDANGRLLATGSNRTIVDCDPTAHAEVVALRAAGNVLGNYRLEGCTVFVTLEPCAMCAMAMVHARIARLVYGAANPKAGACGSVFDLLRDPRHNHRVIVDGGVLAEECGAQLSAYFRAKRDHRRG
ncbi:MAG TPA: tRNA adenosine(34) deaminase TadA [Chiayiivirga sp.]|nr:tRNA adenosine(34) deaminase TadA [Chiayiivirga sp.]